MDAQSLPSQPISSRPHWTIPVSREETLAVREKFRAVSKPNTTKIVVWANQLEGIRNHDQIHNLRIQRLALKNEMRTLYGTLKKAKPADSDRYRPHAAVVKELT
jgi:hypothetical protein